jgi:predicted permease
VSTVLKDVRFGLRVLLRYPGITAVAVVCIALGIGVNSTVFSLVDGFLLRPLPLEEQDRLILVFTADDSYAYGHSSYPDYLDLRQNCQSCADLAAVDHRGFILSGDGFPTPTQSHVVSENYFTALGVSAQLGRVFTTSDSTEMEPVVVISHNLWQRRYGGRDGIVGKSILINDEPHVVIGVAPKGFRGIYQRRDPDLWIPVSDRSLIEAAYVNDRSMRSFAIAGRMRPSATIEDTRSEMSTISRNLESAYPQTNAGYRSVVSTEAESRLRNGRSGLMVLVVVALVLLIACANVANLLLGQAERRLRELVIRLSLGCSRFRLVRQLMTEAALLALLGSALGLLLATWLIKLLPAVVVPPSSFRDGAIVQMDERVLVYSLVSVLLTVFLFALVPALRASRLALAPAYKGSLPQPVVRGWRVTPQGKLVIAQMAVSLVLLVGTGLLAKEFVQGFYTDLGFERKNLLVVDLLYRGQEQQASSFYDELSRRVERIPSVNRTALALRAPLAGFGGGRSAEIRVPGYVTPPNTESPKALYTRVSPDYFRTVGVSLIKGRLFSERDSRPDSGVMLINETMARKFWSGSDPLGAVVRIGGYAGADCTVIGIVRDTKINHITELPEPYFYRPFSSGVWLSRTLLVETAGEALDLAELMRNEISELDKNALVLGISSMNRMVQLELHEEKISMAAVGALGMLGLLLAAFGLYGVVSHSVTRRTREIGVRMALGATNRDALHLVLRQGLRLALAGAAIGLAGGAAVSRVMASEVVGVSQTDLLILLSPAALLIGVAILASYIPARRAAKVDPMLALRDQ